ncbi:MAG: hypothetical protein ABW277_16985, partial [Longimicrobiaceae bacterium]
MTDFLRRLAERAVGADSGVRPALPPRFATYPAPPADADVPVEPEPADPAGYVPAEPRRRAGAAPPHVAEPAAGALPAAPADSARSTLPAAAPAAGPPARE